MIAETLRRFRYVASSEAEFQRGAAAALESLGYTYEREYRLGPGDIIDFAVRIAHTPGAPEQFVGVELKQRGSMAMVARQLSRYAAHEAISALVLLTTKASHRFLPASIGGKRLDVVVVQAGL